MREVLITFVLPHVATIIGAIFGLFIVTRAAQQHRPAGSTIAWLLGVILLPYASIPLYLLFGGRKLSRVVAPTAINPSDERCERVVTPSSLERMLSASGAPPATHTNTCELIVTGEAAFAAVIDTIDKATRSIHISTLIFSGDEVGSAIADKLCSRARQGLEVRVLLDGLFELRSKRAMISRLRRAGAKVVWFMPVFAMPFRNHANLRLHRKVVIADGSVAIVGGMNLASEYMGPTPRQDRWRDLSAIITGEAVRDLARVFAGDWQFATRESLSERSVVLLASGEDKPSAEAAGRRRESSVSEHSVNEHAAPVLAGTSLQVVASGPNVSNDLLYDASLQMIFDAKQRLWLATPYFVPDDALTRAFVIAVRRGVDVRIVLPLRSNHRTADLAGAGFLRDVAAAGGTICCYAPSMLHAKAVLADDKVAVIGSANMDMRSLFLNYELGVFMHSPAQIAELERWFEATFPACVPLPQSSRLRGFFESVARLLAPLE